MSFLSRDRETILGAGRWSMCVECGEGTHINDIELRHLPGCSRSTELAPAGPSTSRPCRDPHMYVMTSRGIERLMDVEARARRGD